MHLPMLKYMYRYRVQISKGGNKSLMCRNFLQKKMEMKKN